MDWVWRAVRRTTAFEGCSARKALPRVRRFDILMVVFGLEFVVRVRVFCCSDVGRVNVLRFC